MSNDPFADLKARAERAMREVAEHRSACSADPCERCERFQCRSGCGRRTQYAGERCPACESEVQRAKWIQRAVAAVPRGFAESSLSAPWLVALVGQKVVDEARDSTSSPQVVALGPAGAGKTTLLAAMLLASDLPKLGSVLWVSAHQLATARAQHPLGEGEAPLVDRAFNAGVLVIDELGGEDRLHSSAVTHVIYERHAWERPTWITTGVSAKEIGDRYGGGIARRVFEDAKVFQLKGRPR